MARILDGICAEEEYKRLRAGLEKQLDACAAGDQKAFELLRDMTDGKPAQTHMHGGDPDGIPMQHQRVEQAIVDPREK